MFLVMLCFSLNRNRTLESYGVLLIRFAIRHISSLSVARRRLMGRTVALESSESESFVMSRCFRLALAARLGVETLVGLLNIAPSRREATYLKLRDCSFSAHVKPRASM